MSGTTTRLALPYPGPTDGPDGADVPHWIQALADALDGAAIDDQGVLSSRPTSTSGTPGIKGRYYMVKGDPDPTQDGILYRDNGTGWDAVNIILAGSVTSADLAAGAVTTAAIAAGAVGSAQIAAGAIGTTQIASKAVTGALLADALKPSAGASNGTEALRAIGAGAGEVLAGNDARLAIISNGSTGTAGTAAVLADSPTLIGNPAAPTQAALDNSANIATTAYIQRNYTQVLAKLTAAVTTPTAAGTQTISFSYAIPAGLIPATGGLRLRFSGSCGAPTGTDTFKLTLGSATIYQNTARNQAYEGEFVMQAQDATNSQLWMYGALSGTTAAIAAGTAVPSSVDLTSAQTLTISFSVTDAIDGEATIKFAILELLP